MSFVLSACFCDSFHSLVVEARGLINKDMFGGKSNPFVVLKLWGQERVSHVVKNCLSPKWNQTFQLYVSSYSLIYTYYDHISNKLFIQYSNESIYIHTSYSNKYSNIFSQHVRTLAKQNFKHTFKTYFQKHTFKTYFQNIILHDF